MVVYSARARHLVTRPDLAQALGEARTPWEILATPISVPGIDYAPGSSDPSGPAVTLGESIRELDLAVSKLIAQQIERFGFALTQS